MSFCGPFIGWKALSGISCDPSPNDKYKHWYMAENWKLSKNHEPADHHVIDLEPKYKIVFAN